MMSKLHAIHTACGIETARHSVFLDGSEPLHAIHTACGMETVQYGRIAHALFSLLHAIHTACGIETTCAK